VSSHLHRDGSAELAYEDLATVLAALLDATRWSGRAIGLCRACRPGRECPEHESNLPSMLAYRRLARALGDPR
jgi:hypothetical protein